MVEDTVNIICKPAVTVKEVHMYDLTIVRLCMKKHQAEERVCSSIYIVVLLSSLEKFFLPDKWRDTKGKKTDCSKTLKILQAPPSKILN